MLEQELAAAVELARGAGRILMDIYAQDFAVAYKGKNDPVTEADKLANAYIVEELTRRFPDDGIVAEESVDRGDSLTKSRCWFVDPLDGTKEFIAKNGEFSVMIGLAVDGKSLLGVVFQPSLDKLYHGVVGQGATLEQQGKVSALRVSEESDPAKLKLVVSRSHRPASIEQIMTRLGTTAEMPSGSVGVKVGLIAERAADLYVHISDKSSLWDACGPEAVLHAAGGRFTHVDGSAISYTSAEMKNLKGILACNRATYDQVLPVVREVSQAEGFLR
ncbi:MAG: 3-5-bisphosphate nucleotidase [Myxococcaceae bacterium]|nr:3-5-bisphosphate nucleotidase [Myxococcaceae bacterium]